MIYYTREELEEMLEASKSDYEKWRETSKLAHLKSAEQNYREGCKYAREHHRSKLWVARSLMQLHNLTHKEVFKEAAEKAYRAYRKERKLVKV